MANSAGCAISTWALPYPCLSSGGRGLATVQSNDADGEEIEERPARGVFPAALRVGIRVSQVSWGFCGNIFFACPASLRLSLFLPAIVLKYTWHTRHTGPCRGSLPGESAESGTRRRRHGGGTSAVQDPERSTALDAFPIAVSRCHRYSCVGPLERGHQVDVAAATSITHPNEITPCRGVFEQLVNSWDRAGGRTPCKACVTKSRGGGAGPPINGIDACWKNRFLADVAAALWHRRVARNLRSPPNRRN